MIYGCIGEKLSHSFSAEIHNRLFGYPYEIKELTPEELDLFMRKKDFKAINVTIPYKECVIPYLDEIDEIAKKIGAVNTIVNRDGRLYGYNTDFFGMKALIEKSKITIKDKKVLILGSGGTAKTAINLAYHLECSSAFLVSRNPKSDAISYDEALKKHSDADIIINTTPCGMYPKTETSAVSVDDFPRLCGVIDAVYNPLRSRLVLDAKRKGIDAVGGLYMLVSQAACAAEIFTGTRLEKEKIDSVYNLVKSEKQNVVLIGMPASGKTTIGKRLAEKLGMDFVDTDLEIEKEYGSTPAKIILSEGEEAFRKLEAKVIKSLANLKATVIATGGGAVLNEENIYNLKSNGRVYFLDRDLKELKATEDRPLSKNPQSLKKLYEERYPIYLSVGDKRIICDKEIENTVNLIKEDVLNENFGN